MMPKNAYMTALFGGWLCLLQSVEAQTYGPFNPIFGNSETYTVWYEDRAGYENHPFTAKWDGGALGTDLTGPYLPHEIVGSYTTDGLTWDLRPETNKFYNGLGHEGQNATNYWRSAPYDDTADGGKYHETLTFYGRTMSGYIPNVIFVFTVNSNTLDTSRYEVEAFMRVVDVSDGTGIIETNLPLNGVTSGTYTQILTVTDAEIWAPAPLQVGFRLLGTNANPAYAASYGSVNVTIDDLIVITCDCSPPTPDPMTWEVEPYAISDNKIGMTATTADDISGVEYVFQRLSGGIELITNDSPHYVATGLNPNTFYSWRVRAQDLSASQEATVFSPIVGATTLPTDTTAPTPDPAEIASITASPSSVSLTATPATDASFVEYNFVPTGTNGTASGWQSSNEYTDSGLTPETTYEYTVQVRDLSAATNMTAVSAPASITTPPFQISIISVVGDTATLQWQSSSGVTYDVVYKTNLTAGLWTPDTANTGLAGTNGVQQATSTVPGDEVFYRLEMQ